MPSACGDIYMQPLIIYLLRVTRVKTTFAMTSPISLYDKREILIMPYTAPAPPLPLEYVPDEYTICAKTALKRHSWDRNLGQLQISASEPMPLNALTASPKASTTLSLELQFTTNNAHKLKKHPKDWRVAVSYYLRSRTFFSTKKLERLPAHTEMYDCPWIHVHYSKTPLEARGYGPLIWKENRISEQQAAIDSNRAKSWSTMLSIPINAPKSLLPTFLNLLSARQYAVVLKVKILAHHHHPLKLVVPVQVIYHPLKSIPPPYVECQSATNAQDSILWLVHQIRARVLS